MDASKPGLAKLPKRGSTHFDGILDRVLSIERAERQKLGVEQAFQAEVDHWLYMWTKSDAEVAASKTKMQQEKITYEREVDKDGWANGTGRRKAAVAQVWIRPGNGLDMKVKREGAENFRLMVDYFDAVQLTRAIQPLEAVKQLGNFDVKAVVYGGGLMGQASALSLGIARALQAWDPNYRPVLKQAGFLTRDARIVERKKPGQKKARKKFQWVKR